MRTPLFTIALPLSLLLAAAPAAAAGVVKVSFKPVHELADAGRDRYDGARNVELLAEHFKSLAARLPDGQTLEVEVTDLDLAGEMKPTRRGSDLRVLTGRADWPSLTLRWSLSDGSRTLASGDERVADMNYLMHPLRGSGQQALGYEMRLVDRWFDERVLGSAR